MNTLFYSKHILKNFGNLLDLVKNYCLLKKKKKTFECFTEMSHSHEYACIAYTNTHKR